MKTQVLSVRVIRLSGRYLQVISNDSPEWEEWASLYEFLKQRAPRKVLLSQPLTSSAIVLGRASNHQYFALKSHFAAWDRWFKKLVFQHLDKAYNNIASYAPNSTFATQLLKRIQVTDGDLQHSFCASQLSKVPLAPSSNKPAEARPYSFNVSFSATDRDTSIKPSVVVQAAWTLVVLQRTLSDTALLTVLISGREYPLPGIGEIAAPTVAQIPLQISIDRQKDVSTWLESIRERLISVIPFMHTDWDVFRSYLGDDLRKVWESSPLVVAHSVSERQKDDEALPLGLKQVKRIFMHKVPFTIECYASSESIKTDIFYEETVFSLVVVQDLCSQFEVFTELIFPK